MAERFAIYYAPSATGALWERASTWLGRDAQTGEFLSGTVAGLDRDRLLDLTQTASRYGFHATMKAPMTLAAGTTEAELRQAVAEFSSEHQPIELGHLRLELIDGFLALTADDSEYLQNFAAHVVETFEPFRAPLTAKERAARIAKGLTPRQEELLDAYGYPYVFDEFRFHMTLSDRLPEPDAADLLTAAQTWFGPVLEESVVLDRLSLFQEPETGKSFRRIGDFLLGTPPK